MSLVPSIIPAVISQHADEASFLWTLRNGAVVAPHYGLDDLARLDGRIEAHFDALRIAGEEGWSLLEERLAFEESGEVFAASALAFETKNEPHIQKVLEVVTKESVLTEGVVSALGWLSFEQVAEHIKNFLGARAPLLRRIGIAGCAVHRQNPDAALADALMSDDFLLKGRALRAVGELGRADLVSKVLPSLSAENEKVRLSAAWSAALLSSDGQALNALKTLAEGASPHSEKSMQLLARRLSLADAKVWQKKLSQNLSQRRLAIITAGAIGDPEFIPWLIDQMKIPPLARPAGEALTMITGVDLAYRDLERKPPEDFQSGPTEDPNDENVEMDPDDNLPWPEPALLQKWWEQNRSQFQSGTRYLLGKPMTVEWLKTVLRDGRQRQRTAAALELAIRQPGQTLFNVAAPGFRQQQVLGKGEVIR
jgi:uncharacterized protein (TIGR02270 family)